MANKEDYRPLADRMRPQSLDYFFGQSHILGRGRPLRQAIENACLHSMVFWGPPGTGKTSLARLIAAYCSAQFLTLSATLSSVKDIHAAIEKAQQCRAIQKKETVLFIDEVHRFNKAQQDRFLPFVEDGTITLIGATTENPSFELNNALLSRLRVYLLKALTQDEIVDILQRALGDVEQGLGDQKRCLSQSDLAKIARAADGDARRSLNLLELVTDLMTSDTLEDSVLDEVLANGTLRRFDKGADVFYDQISALHKSVRGSDPDAALYWFARMIDGGCDPLYIARRTVRIALEDIGNADPRALHLALDSWDTQQRLGSPEGELAIAQAIIYLACAAKSNATYVAFNAAMQDAKKYGSTEVPMHLRNAPTRLMKGLGYGKDYRYAHNEPSAYAAGEDYFPEKMEKKRYYFPVQRGLEVKIAEKLAYLKKLDEAAKK